MTYTSCTNCNKDVTQEKGIINPRGICPHCDSIDTFRVYLLVEKSFLEVMDGYYPSCRTKAETLGSVADKNTKQFGRGFVEDNAEIQKRAKRSAMEVLAEQSGKPLIKKKSSGRPFYRPNSDKPISQSECDKIAKELNIDTKKLIKERPSGNTVRIKKCRKK